MIARRAVLCQAVITGKLKRQVLFVNPNLAAVFGFDVVPLVEVKACIAPVALGREDVVQRLAAYGAS